MLGMYPFISIGLGKSINSYNALSGYRVWGLKIHNFKTENCLVVSKIAFSLMIYLV